MNKYEKIINYDYQLKHQRMSVEERSYVFAPFSALVGFNDLIKENERETSSKIELSNSEKELLDYKISVINENLFVKPKIRITYFIDDELKNGGKYVEVTDYIKRVDFNQKVIVLENKNKINIDNIINIDSDDINFRDYL